MSDEPHIMEVITSSSSSPDSTVIRLHSVYDPGLDMRVVCESRS
jgi:hypothetical protein